MMCTLTASVRAATFKRTSRGQLTKNFRERSSGLLNGTGIVDDVVGGGSLLVQWPLARLACLERFRCPASMLLRPPASFGVGCVNKHDGVTKLVPSCFKKHGCIEYYGPDRRRSAGLVDALSNPFSNAGMNDLLQITSRPFPVGRWTENLGGERRSIDSSLRVEHGCSEARVNAASYLRVGQHVVADPVAVDQLDSYVAGNPMGQRALTTPHSSDEPDYGYIRPIRHELAILCALCLTRNSG